MLPILELRDRLAPALETHRRLILQAPTGSGKSTQIPQYLLDLGLLGDGQVLILQPRRIAARLLATRVAQERHGKLGDEVGYQIRLDDISSKATRIKYITEGILLRQILNNPSLHGVSAIVFDEFHERHLYGDISLARALDLQQTRRPDLLLLVMSATLNTELLRDYLAPCATLTSEGRTFPVVSEHIARDLSEREPVWDAAAEEAVRVLKTQPEGDLLIFMPGGYEISRTIQAIQNRPLPEDVIVLPLHGELTAADQDKAVARYAKRKIIVSTNVAETSLTIDGVRAVIDSGLARVAKFDPHRGINTLLIEKISRASAEQRAGRAGRTAPGICVRLWSQRDHVLRPNQEKPEVHRLDLSEVVLTLKASGVEDIGAFRWLEKPEPRALERALHLLEDLGALDHSGAITPVGRRMLAFPLHPRYARMLLAADTLGCVPEAALIAALTQTRSLLMRSEGKRMEELRDDLFGEESQSDLYRLMRAWQYAEDKHYDNNACRAVGIHIQTARQVSQIFQQFLDIARRERLNTKDSKAGADAIRKCVLLGFSDQIGRRTDGGTLRCELVHGRVGSIGKDSRVQSSPLVVASEITEIGSSGGDIRVQLNLVTAIEPAWLSEFFPDDFKEQDRLDFDSTTRRVFRRIETRFRDLVLSGRTQDVGPSEEAAQILAAQCANGTLKLNGWDDAVDQFIFRVNRLAEWMPDLGLEKIDEAAKTLLLTDVCQGAVGYKDIKDKPVLPALRDWLSHDQLRALDAYAPERYELPGGRKAKITYAAEGQPVIASRIQDFYGVNRDIKIANGRVPVLIHLLAPNQRPVQMTTSLENFWKDTYPQVKAELSRKYPRHEWR
jgi:ATP-dependent helicase HrpB